MFIVEKILLLPQSRTARGDPAGEPSKALRLPISMEPAHGGQESKHPQERAACEPSADHLPGSGQRTADAERSPSCDSECSPTKCRPSSPHMALPFTLTFTWGSARSFLR